MSKTFENLSGQTLQIIDGETSVDTNEDIVSGKVSGYFVILGDDHKYEVDEPTYKAVKEYIES
jgi:hypothetical protein